MTDIIPANTETPVVENLQLTATMPDEMVEAQTGLIFWCDKKLSSLKAESADLKEAYEIALDRKWNTVTLKNQYNKSVKQITYYEKMKAALEAGYYIVPNFPVQMFAIRTKKYHPNKDSYSYWSDHQQTAQELPIGSGEYKNPFPLVIRKQEVKDGQGKTIRDALSYPDDWDEIDFPVTMAKPRIMEATSQAMALNIFDQFGIMPATRKEDPVIIGQIKISSGYRTKLVSFMIAWHLDTKVL